MGNAPNEASVLILDPIPNQTHGCLFKYCTLSGSPYDLLNALCCDGFLKTIPSHAPESCSKEQLRTQICQRLMYYGGVNSLNSLVHVCIN